MEADPTSESLLQEGSIPDYLDPFQPRPPATQALQFFLQDALDALEAATKDGAIDDESKRWQANYYYVKAKVEAKFAYVYEYDYMLGQIRKDALPPPIMLLPFQRPDCRVNGARPAKLAISRRFSVPSSGSSARKVRAKVLPTPGTVIRRSSFSRHAGDPRTSSPISSSTSSNSFSSILT